VDACEAGAEKAWMGWSRYCAAERRSLRSSRQAGSGRAIRCGVDEAQAEVSSVIGG